MTGDMIRKAPLMPSAARPQSVARRSIFIPGPRASHSSTGSLLGGCGVQGRPVSVDITQSDRNPTEKPEPTVSVTVTDLKGQTVAFAASGGLDSCTVTRWLTEAGVTVVCFTADMAQPDEPDYAAIEKRMRASGAADFVSLDLKAAIAEAGLEVIQSQACYEGRYWNTTGIGRHVIVAGMVKAMRQRGISILSHGATGRGNDQVRFQLCTNMLAPDFQVYAPWRDEN